MKVKSKFNKRRALNCTLVGKSKRHQPDYYKYNVRIGEKDGTTHTQPAYGKDMQDALQRLLWKERTKKIEKKLTAGWIFVGWLATMAWPAFVVGDTNDPTFLLCSLGSMITLIIVGVWWWNYINKE